MRTRQIGSVEVTRYRSWDYAEIALPRGTDSGWHATLEPPKLRALARVLVLAAEEIETEQKGRVK